MNSNLTQRTLGIQHITLKGHSKAVVCTIFCILPQPWPPANLNSSYLTRLSPQSLLSRHLVGVPFRYESIIPRVTCNRVHDPWLALPRPMPETSTASETPNWKSSDQRTRMLPDQDPPCPTTIYCIWRTATIVSSRWLRQPGS